MQFGNRLMRIPGQLLRRNPFSGDIVPARVSLFARGRRAAPFPHPWNYRRPLEILDAYFAGADQDEGPGRHNRYLDVPGFPPVLVTRDPGLIRAITTQTGDGEGQFDRDTLPSGGIARATGRDTLLYSNGGIWRRQRKLAASPFGKTTLFQPERFHEFGEEFRQTVRARLDLLKARLEADACDSLRLELEPEIKGVMLELLTNCFFGTEIPYTEIRERYVPAIDRLIAHIVRDTVTNLLGIPVQRLPGLTRGLRQAQADQADFDQLTDLVLAGRREGRGQWAQFKSDAPDAALRSNLKVFLAGALEATTSYASWAISHLARSPAVQQRVHVEVRQLEIYTPECLEKTPFLRDVLDETLRLTPSLYFLPRRAAVDTTVCCADEREIRIPAGTHILLDVWHANRHEDHWGSAATGAPADVFAPERWETIRSRGRGSKEQLHFGFGHGPRVCPGKHLGELEVALAVGGFVKLFEFTAPQAENLPRAGVSTKPADGTLVEIRLREPAAVVHRATVPAAGA